MEFFSSLLVGAATASDTEANESTDEASVEQPAPRSLADLRRCLQGSPPDVLAFLISALTSPFLVCTVVGAALGARFASSWREVVAWGGLAALFAGLIPFGVVVLLLLRGRVTDIHVAQRERRWVPLGAAALSGALSVVVLHLLRTPKELQALGVTYLVNAVAFAGVSLQWKISVHTGVYAGAFVACGLTVNGWWLVALAAVPLVAWARARRGRHTQLQGIAGAAMASLLTVLTYEAAAAGF